MHTEPTPKDYHEVLALGVNMLVRQPDLLTSEAREARAWFAAICRTDFSAAIREYTHTNGDEVWTIRWDGNRYLIIGEQGQSLSDVMIHAMQVDRESKGRAD